MHRLIVTGLTTALAAGAVAVPASAQSTTTPAPTASSTIHINNCTVKKSRNAGGFTYAYCAIVATGSGSISVKYTSNLPTYAPLANADYGPQSKTISLPGGGIQNIKLAFKKLTVSQVTAKLKVTLSNPKGATITDGVATAKSSS
jgi:hypothetical protein